MWIQHLCDESNPRWEWL
jgi:hypothetical protein